MPRPRVGSRARGGLGVAKRGVPPPGSRGHGCSFPARQIGVSCPRPPGCSPPGPHGRRRPAHKTRRHEAAGGPRGGNQDHIQRGSRLNFQPRVCRGAWSCLVNAAGNTWDTLTALIVPTHSAVDEL